MNDPNPNVDRPLRDSDRAAQTVISAEKGRGSGQTQRRGPARRVLRWTMPIMLTMFALIWLAPHPLEEVSSWYLAAAIAQHDEGKTEAAFELIDKAESWHPDNPSIALTRAAWLAAEGKPEEAIEQLDRLLEIRPFNPTALQKRAELLQQIGRHEAASDDMTTFVAVVGQSIERRTNTDPRKAGIDDRRTFAHALNSQAYVLARAAEDQQVDDEALAQAIDDTQWAVDVLQDYRRQLNLIEAIPERAKLDLAIEVSMVLDTLGYLQYHLGDYDQAIANLNSAVHLAEQTMPRLDRRLRTTEIDLETIAAEEAKMQAHMAVILHHRGQVLNALGREYEARRDLKQAKQFGFSRENGVW